MKKLLCPLLCLILVLPLSACSVAPPPTDSAVIYHNYRDIPGLTGEELQAIEALHGSQEPFIFGMLNSTEAFFWEDGTPGGVSALICAYLSELFEVEFRLCTYEWDQLVRALASGEVSLSSEFRTTAAREEVYRMSDTLHHRVVKLIRLREAERQPAASPYIHNSRVPRYIFLEGASTYEQLAGSLTDPFAAVFAGTHGEALEMLRQGVADGLLCDDTVESISLSAPDLVMEDFYPLIYEPVSLTTADSRFSAVISVVDKLMANGGDRYVQELYRQGYASFLQYAFHMGLTEEEQAYIADLRDTDTALRIIVEHDNYPVCFYNETEREFQGIAIDILEEISFLTGLTFRQRTDLQEWSAMLKALENGEADMITELVYAPARRYQFAWTESPYMVDHYALLSRSDTPAVTYSDVMSSSVGLIDSTIYMQMFLTWFPEHNDFTVYPDNEAAFQALESGEVKLLMAKRNLLLSFTNYKEQPVFQVSLLFDRTYESRFGIHKGNQLLAGIVDKAQAMIDTDHITTTWTSKVFDYRVKMYQMRMPYLIATCVLLGGVLLMALMMLLRGHGQKKLLERIVLERTHKLEEQARDLEVQTQAAQEASRAKGAFLARMSHEIRTPLNAIIGMTQIALLSPEHSPRHRSQLDETRKASAHLLEIINDVLDMSKIESGKLSLLAEPFRLFTALDEVVSIFTLRCREKQLAFETNLAGFADTNVLGDRLHLKQVLINLLGNAVKFTGENGEIRFLVDVTEETEEQITVAFSVADTGIGMTAEQTARLFHAFEQADNTISARFGGSGLGLAISQHLVGQMGGEIRIHSTYGEGSTFSFALTFDKAPDAGEPNAAPEEAQAPDLSGRRILLAEDIEINRVILIELLGDTGVAIEEAADGRQAVELFEASAPGYYDLIFMDVQMPEMDGYEATRRIRAMSRPDAADIPIVAMTANAYSEDIGRERDAGMDGHISKPIDIDEVKRYLWEQFFSDSCV